MPESKTDIISRLQRDVLRLQGFKPAAVGSTLDLGPITTAFPNSVFPLGAIHEFLTTSLEDTAATTGFLSGLLSSLLKTGGTCIWIGNSRTLFPIALHGFGITPQHIIFIDLPHEKEILWAMEEALKCSALVAVVSELTELNFTASRRLQLAVEQSQVTGFVIRKNPRGIQTTASVTKWKITSLPSEVMDELPGIGFPKWNVELLKVRNGMPGNWQLEWVNGRFRFIEEAAYIVHTLQQKTG